MFDLLRVRSPMHLFQNFESAMCKVLRLDEIPTVGLSQSSDFRQSPAIITGGEHCSRYRRYQS